MFMRSPAVVGKIQTISNYSRELEMGNVITIKDVHKNVWKPAMELLPKKMDTKEAAVIGLTTGLQESLLVHRYQLVAGKPGVKGPARGLWQFERGGGVKGVLTHKASAGLAKEIQAHMGHGVGIDAAYEALEKDDVFAAVFARLLYYTDPYSLPEVGQSQRAWNLYQRTWRPGRPHPETWAGYYKEVVDAIV